MRLRFDYRSDDDDETDQPDTDNQRYAQLPSYTLRHQIPSTDRPASINVQSDLSRSQIQTQSLESGYATSPTAFNNRPSTLFLRSNQHAAESASKGIGMMFDLGISISSGECVLHADPPSK